MCKQAKQGQNSIRVLWLRIIFYFSNNHSESARWSRIICIGISLSASRGRLWRSFSAHRRNSHSWPAHNKGSRTLLFTPITGWFLKAFPGRSKSYFCYLAFTMKIWRRNLTLDTTKDAMKLLLTSNKQSRINGLLPLSHRKIRGWFFLEFTEEHKNSTWWFYTNQASRTNDLKLRKYLFFLQTSWSYCFL
jgi:hypothetical protein